MFAYVKDKPDSLYMNKATSYKLCIIILTVNQKLQRAPNPPTY